MDRSPGMLDAARTRGRGQAVALVRADAARLPSPAESFDAIAAAPACFASEPAPVLAEAARVPRPGGRPVLGELNRWSVRALPRRLSGLVRPSTYRAARFRGIGELLALLAGGGPVPIRWEGLIHLPPLDQTGILRGPDPVGRLGRCGWPAFGAFLAVEARRGGL